MPSGTFRTANEQEFKEPVRLMNTDLLGNPVSCDGDALDGVNDFVDGFLRYQPRAVNVLAAADRQPDSVLPNIFAGCLWMFLEAPEAAQKARPFLQRANQHLDSANSREKALFAILDTWIADDVPASLRYAEQLLSDHPHDLIALKLAQYHCLNLGDSPGMLRTALKVRDANNSVAQLHGMIAFGYEQCHLLDKAKDAAETAMSIEADEPWAHHALAHVLLTRGETEAGIRFMESVSSTWDGLNSFMFTHNWWHLALFKISAGDLDAALRIYDERCWGVEPGYSQDQVGAISLLARLEFCGVDVGDRWQELKPHLVNREADTVQPFLTLQYLYGLARANASEADDLLDAVRQFAGIAPAFSRDVWSDIALPACEGVLAHARGDHQLAIKRLSQVLPQLWRVGGSHAQRDLFEQILLDAVLKEQRWISAQQMLEARRRFDPDGIPLNRCLAEVYDRLGLSDESAAALKRAAFH